MTIMAHTIVVMYRSMVCEQWYSPFPTQIKRCRPSHPYPKNHCPHCTSTPASTRLWSCPPCQIIPANRFPPSPALLSLPVPLLHQPKRIGYRRSNTSRKDTMGFWDFLLVPTFYIRSWFREHCYRLICMQHATCCQERRKLY